MGASLTTSRFRTSCLQAFIEIKILAKYPDRPVSWSLAFTIHAILTSIFETQGSQHFSFLAETAQRSFDTYLEQLNWGQVTVPVPIPWRPRLWDHLIRGLREYWYFTNTKLEQTPLQTLLSLWNPFCGGLFLTYVAYHGDVVAGNILLDSVGQLRMTLHLINALKLVGVWEQGTCQVLDWIFETYKSCKAIWEGQLPMKGQLCTRWWIAQGLTPTAAQERSGQTLKSKSSFHRKTNRNLTPLE